jgi:hypothetical protein
MPLWQFYIRHRPASTLNQIDDPRGSNQDFRLPSCRRVALRDRRATPPPVC